MSDRLEIFLQQEGTSNLQQRLDDQIQEQSLGKRDAFEGKEDLSSQTEKKQKTKEENGCEKEVSHFVELLKQNQGDKAIATLFTEYANRRGKCGRSLLDMSIYYKNKVFVHFLIKMGANINQKLEFYKPDTLEIDNPFISLQSFTYQEMSPILMAVVTNNNEVFDFLIEKKVDIKQKYKVRLSYYQGLQQGHDLLDVAIHVHNTHAIKYFLRQGFDLTNRELGDVSKAYLDKFPQSWKNEEGYAHIDDQELYTYMTLEVLVLCIKENYQFKEYIITHSGKFKEDILRFCIRESAIQRFQEAFSSFMVKQTDMLNSIFQNKVKNYEKERIIEDITKVECKLIKDISY